MSSTMRQPDQKSDDAATRKALDHLLEEYDRVRADKEALEVRLHRFADTIQTLLNTLSDGNRLEYTARFVSVKAGTPPRAGETFNNVIWLVQKYPDRTWTVPDVKMSLESEGRPAPNAKAISNAMLYLSKIGRLKRVGWGQYMITALGAAMEVDEQDDGTVRNSEHYV